MKALVCREHGVEVFFEDNAAVLAHMDEGTVCLQPFSNSGDDAEWATRQTV